MRPKYRRHASVLALIIAPFVIFLFRTSSQNRARNCSSLSSSSAVESQPVEMNPLESLVDTGPHTVFSCGYSLDHFSQIVFPEYKRAVYNESVNPTHFDILLIGMHSKKCTLLNLFPGKILYLNGEARVGDMVDGAYYLGPINDNMNASERARQLYYVSYAALEIRESNAAFKERPRGSGEDFLVYISSNCLPHRERMFDLFSTIGNTSAGGKCHGTTPLYKNSATQLARGRWPTAWKAYERYKFGLVMENSLTEGYISEKILTAFVGGTVPIYYGTPEVFEIFNKDAFIYLNDSNIQDVLSEVKYLLSDRAEYERRAGLPVLAQGAHEKYFWHGKTQINQYREHIGISPLRSNDAVVDDSASVSLSKRNR